MPTQFITTRLVSKESGQEYYLGCIKYYDGDQYLYSEWTKIHRLNEEDARFDAQVLSEDH